MTNEVVENETEMAQNEKQNSKKELLASFVAEEPEKQTRKTAARADFIPDPDVLARVTAALTKSGAITGAKGYGSDKEARSAGAWMRVYAEHAVEGIEGKSIGPRIVKRGDLYHWKFQLTTKRERKEKADTAPVKANGKEKASK